MKTETLKHVENECRRFLKRLKVIQDIELNNEKMSKQRKDTGVYHYSITGTRNHGAMRRAAHDLKEALTLITQNRDL